MYSTVRIDTQHSGRGLQEDDISRDGFRRLILDPAYVGAMGNTQSKSPILNVPMMTMHRCDCRAPDKHC